MDDIDDDSIATGKTMRLRYPGRCRSCNRDLAAGSTAIYHRESKTLSCLECLRPDESPVSVKAAESVVDVNEVPEDVPSAVPEIFAGNAGASARREGDRRSGKREKRIRDAHPKLGGLILALSEDPQSTKAWVTGAQGEERLGKRLDSIAGEGTLVLHDRRVPPGKGNIDHIVVCPSGVFVIDAKKYTGRPNLRVEGGFFRPRTETLMVGSRKETKLVTGIQGQIDKVKSVLDAAGLGDIAVSGMLCFVGADWPLIGGDFTIDSVRVLWPNKALTYLTRAGELNASRASQVHQVLAAAFPVA